MTGSGCASRNESDMKLLDQQPYSEIFGETSYWAHVQL